MFKNASLLCFYDEQKGINTCEECNINYEYYIDDDGVCKNCNSTLDSCLKEKNGSYCRDLLFSKNCKIYHEKLCPELCTSCKFERNKTICFSCSSNKEPNHNRICEPCPKDLINENGECKVICDGHDKIFSNENCFSCSLSNSIYRNIICPDICPIPNQILINRTCEELSKLPTCLQPGPLWCELCSKISNTYECRFERGLIGYLQYRHLRFRVFKINEDYYTCPKNYRLDENIIEDCDYHEGKINHDEKFLKPLRHPQKISRLCPEYIEGFYIIYVNETCLYTPSTHYNIFRYQYALKNVIKTKQNKRIAYIKITNSTNLSGNIIADILYLQSCPYRFYDDSQGNCLFCGQECLICSGPEADQCNLMTNYDSEFLNEHIPGQSFLLLTVEANQSDYIPVHAYKKSCFLGCKLCYYTGKENICLECHDELNMNRLPSECSCKYNKKFDVKTSKCLKTCPIGSKFRNLYCHSSCLLDLAESMIDFIDDDGICLPICLENKYSIINFEFEDEPKCIYNEFQVKLLNFDSKSYIFTLEKLANLLWQKGLVQLTNVVDKQFISKFFYSFLHSRNSSFDSFDLFETTDRILQAATILLGSVDEPDYIFIVDFVDNLIPFSSSLDRIWKIHYFFQVIKRPYLKIYESKWFKFTEIDLFNASQATIEIPGEIRLIFEGIEPYSQIFIAMLKLENRGHYLSVKVQSANSSFFKRIHLNFEALNPNLGNVYFANYTSEYMGKLLTSEQIEIFHNCIYFIEITDSFVNESFYAMVDQDLFYGLNLLPEIKNDEKERLEDNDNEGNENTILYIFVAISGGLIALFVVFKRKLKSSENSKPKFIQMSNRDSDEEFDEENEDQNH